MMGKLQRRAIVAKGFTLIEVMVVVAIIGVVATLVQFTFAGNRPEDLLKESSDRFKAIFEVASDYSMLNNIELGVVIKKNSYQFLGYDGTRWAEIPEQNWLSNVELPEGVELKVALDDLPIDEPLLFNADTFKEKAEDEFTLLSKEEQEQQIIPQIYILSGGDITPFSVTFRFGEQSPQVMADGNVLDFAYKVTGIYSVPLTTQGPILDE
ncbi:GspH family T2SS minor pseudopilin variant XcpU [Colwellia asteriadis]|uniref:Type II secretion system protein H n=1 Tax=Colwellia asteriadis TaxID=517723 RepID=A0ABP3WE34_9GAMM